MIPNKEEKLDTLYKYMRERYNDYPLKLKKEIILLEIKSEIMEAKRLKLKASLAYQKLNTEFLIRIKTLEDAILKEGQ